MCDLIHGQGKGDVVGENKGTVGVVEIADDDAELAEFAFLLDLLPPGSVWCLFN